MRADPAVEILRVAAEHAPSVVVLCSSTLRRAPQGAFSPVSERVLAGTIGPVVLVRPERGDIAWNLGRLLLAHDGTPAATAALRPAAELGARAGAQVWTLHVAQTGGEPPREPGSFPAPRYVDQRQHEWPTWTQEFASRLAPGCAAGPGQPELALERGEPASAIVRFSHRARRQSRRARMARLARSGARPSAQGRAPRRDLPDDDHPVCGALGAGVIARRSGLDRRARQQR